LALRVRYSRYVGVSNLDFSIWVLPQEFGATSEVLMADWKRILQILASSCKKLQVGATAKTSGSTKSLEDKIIRRRKMKLSVTVWNYPKRAAGTAKTYVVDDGGWWRMMADDGGKSRCWCLDTR
jgi:hypothetical protein